MVTSLARYTDLGGRLEKVYLDTPMTGTMLAGSLTEHDRRIAVSNAINHYQKNALVKVDFHPSYKELTGQFITALVPEDFKGLNSRDFVLSGMLEKEMGISIDSSLDDVNKYWEPGNIGQIVVVTLTTPDKIVGYTFGSQGTRRFQDEYKALFYHMPKPARRTRTVLFEREKDEQRIREFLRNHNRYLILMDKKQNPKKY